MRVRSDISKYKSAIEQVSRWLRFNGGSYSGIKDIGKIVLFAQRRYGEKIETPAAFMFCRRWLINKYDSDSNFGYIPPNKRPERVNMYQNNSETKQSYSEFLKSKYWHRVRKMVLKRDDYTCGTCGSKLRLQVHHLSYDNHLNEHLHLDDLITICHRCHCTLHNNEY